METINVSLGTLKSWFAKTDNELVNALFDEKDGEKSPKEQQEVDKLLDSLFTERMKSFESKFRNEGHGRGLKETAEKVESKLREYGIDASNWNEGLEKLAKLEKVKVQEVTPELIKESELYKSLHAELNKEREAHKETVSNYENEKINSSVKTYFKKFISDSEFDLPSGETEEEKAIRENWIDLYIERAVSKSKWKVDDKGNPIPVDETGSALEIDFKPISASQIAEQTASSMFRKLNGKKRGDDEKLSKGEKTIQLPDGKAFKIPKAKDDIDFMNKLNELRSNKNVPVEAIEQFITDFEASQV